MLIDDLRPPIGRNPLLNWRFLINLPKFARLVLRLFRDKRVWLPPKAVLGVGLALNVAYFLWPLDILPDFAPPIAGWLDDGALIWLTLYLFVRLCPRNVVQEHVEIINHGG
jgi:uncharacterized membrane protein YkvA (DUF1232 family)